MMDFIDWVYTNTDHNVVLKQTEAETLLRELLRVYYVFYITSFNKQMKNASCCVFLIHKVTLLCIHRFCLKI